MVYNPVDNMNLLQKLGMIAQSVATQGQSIQPILQQQMQAKQLSDVGNVLAGTGIPEFAFKEQTPEQIAQAKQQQLAALGNPTAFQALQQLQEREITPYQQAQLNQQNKELGLRQSELGLRRQDQALQRDLLRQDRADRKNQRDADQAQAYAEKLSKRVEGTGVADLVGALDRLDALVPEKGNIEGVGYLGGLKPMAALSENGKSIQQEVAQVQNAILKARSGGAVTPAESDRLLKELGTGAFSSEDQLRRGLNNVRRTFGNKLKSIEAGYPKDALAVYRESGGITSDHFGSRSKASASAGSTGDYSKMSNADLMRALQQ